MTREHALVTFLRARYDEQEAREKSKVTLAPLYEMGCPRCGMQVHGWSTVHDGFSGTRAGVMRLDAPEHSAITCDHRLDAEEWKAFLRTYGTPAADEAALRRLDLNREMLKLHQPVWVAYEHPDEGEWSCPSCTRTDERGKVFHEAAPCMHLRLLASEFHGHPDLKGWGLG